MLARIYQKEEKPVFSYEIYTLYNRRKYDFLYEETSFLKKMERFLL